MSSTQCKSSTSKESVHETKSLIISSDASRQAWLNELGPKYYKMDHSKRGIAVIFNAERFNLNLNLNTRSGSRNDYDYLIQTLISLGFKIWKRFNPTHTDVIKTLETVAKVDHSKSDCLMIIVLSYGTRDHLYATDTCYEANFLFNHFTADKCPTLAGKPKLFFIQACAYCNVLDSGITPFMQKETDLTNSTFCIERDFLIFYSTIPGRYSWHITKRTWFIEALCKKLYQNGSHYDLVTLLTSVSNYVTSDYWPLLHTKLTEDEKKQNPCIISMLTRLVKFTPK